MTDFSNRLPALSAELLSLRAGGVRPLGPEALPSAIDKRPLLGKTLLGPSGVAGDAQADAAHHGGPHKALHSYPSEHYAAWRRELPERATLFEIGAFGENLSTRGVTEATVCLGDVFALGDAVIEVSQGRQPCVKLNLRFERADMVARVLATGRTGWYCRVLVAGAAGAGDVCTLIERPCPAWPLARVHRVLFGSEVERPALEALSRLSVLAPSWRQRALRRLGE